MNSIPAHKQTDPAKLPGQIVNPIPDPGTEHTLAQYIQRKLRNDAFNTVKQEQTFDQWFTEYNRAFGLPPAYEVAKAAWNAAKGNSN